MALADQEKLYLIDKLDRVMEQGRRYKERAAVEKMLYIHAAETAGAAGVIGFYEGRTGKQTLVDGIPLDFAVAAAMYGLGFFGVGQEAAQHLYAVGNGGLAVFLYKQGRELGQKAAAPLPAVTSGAAPALLPPHSALSDAEIARLVESSRALG